jgi:hypothetical protein
MKIREASLADRELWDSFVDSQGGVFQHYFNWKFAVENKTTQYIQVMIESDSLELIGIFPIIRKHGQFYSKLNSICGPLFKKDISKEERYKITKAALEYIEKYYTKDCSRFFLEEQVNPKNEEQNGPNPALTELGFRSIYDPKTQLPSKYMLELKPPFEQNIWMGLWSHKIRQTLRKAEQNGFSVIEDTEMGDLEEFVDMLISNYKRHNIMIPARDDLLSQMKMQTQYFKGKLRLFIALFENKPIVMLYCSYTASICQLEAIGSYSKDTDNANKLCYKAAIEQACNAGYKYVDFGATYTSSLGIIKERFGATRFPILRYEKRYSFLKTMIELAPVMVSELWRKRTQIWTDRRHYWNIIMHR